MKTISQIFTKFHYAFVLTRSSLGLLHIIFRTFVPELWPLIYSKLLFPLNIFGTNEQILTKLYITIYTDNIYVGIVSIWLSQIGKRVMVLYWCQNYVYTQYPEKLRPFTACTALQRGYSQNLWQFLFFKCQFMSTIIWKSVVSDNLCEHFLVRMRTCAVLYQPSLLERKVLYFFLSASIFVFNHLLLVMSADNLFQTAWTQIRTTKMFLREYGHVKSRIHEPSLLDKKVLYF